MSDGSASPAPTATPVSTPPATPPCTPPPTRPASPGAAAAAAAARSASPSAARRKGEAEEREGAATPDDAAAAAASAAAATSASSRSSSRSSSSGVLPPVGAAGAGAAAAAALATAPQLVRSAVAASAAGDAAPGGPSAAAAAATASVGVQASAPPPYRLRVLPARGGGCVRVAARAALSQAGLAALLMAWALLGAWAFRATEGPHERQRASGVRLEQQKLADELAEAARRLAEDGGACGDDTAWRDAAQVRMTAWRAAARQYVVRHEQMLLDAVDDGFGEGGGGYIWTFSGCLLFAVSLLTTLGFGAPVPRTTGGRAAAAVFAAVGIPLHLLLALNAGALFAAHLTRLALRLEARRRRLRLAPSASAPATASPSPGGRCCASPRWPCGDACWLPAPWAVACAPAAWPCSRRRGECAPAPGPVPARGPLPAVAPTDAGDKFPPIALDAQSALEAGEAKGAWAAEEAAAAAAAEAPGPPAWLRWLPVSAAFLYYLVGLVAFGAARGRPFAACLLFPLDFTATGGVGRVAGALRAVYALYLEGAVLLAFTGVALHRADAARGLTALGLRWRLIVADHV